LALPTLTALAGSYEMPVVITRPDKPRGRGREPKRTPVGEEAGRLGLQVAMPESAEQLKESLEAAGPLDLGVVVAYGRGAWSTFISLCCRGGGGPPRSAGRSWRVIP
jgi:methionyl-tRNA formyltransferase